MSIPARIQSVTQQPLPPSTPSPDPELKKLGGKLFGILWEAGGNCSRPSHLDIQEKKFTSPIHCKSCQSDITFGKFTITNRCNGKKISGNFKMVHDLFLHGIVKQDTYGRPFLDLTLLKEVLSS